MFRLKLLIWPTVGTLLIGMVNFRGSSPTEDRPLPTATLPVGEVIGTTSVQRAYPYATVNEFLGVPFAQTPPERFQPAVLVGKWDSPLSAKEHKPACHQHFIREHFREIFNDPPLPESEDCLYLNIFAPAGRAGVSSGLPVLFWIHGGNLQLGSGRQPEFDGSSIAANQNVIVVTINYRLSVFGFPASPDIPLEGRNLGFMDQRLALTWVYDNIGAFGGDPEKITISGESAGAYSVKQLVAIPPEPLSFRAAILQSQSRGVQGNGDESWQILAKDLGCIPKVSGASQLSCLQTAPAEDIMRIVSKYGLGFSPSADRRTDVGDFAIALDQRKAAKVPMMIGTNADEGTILAVMFPTARQTLESIFHNDSVLVERALAAYPEDMSQFELKSRIITDFGYTCATSALASFAANTGQRVWRYYFNGIFPNSQPFPNAGAWHTSEIGLIFGTYPTDSGTTPQEIRLSQYMQQAWSQFVKDPEGGPGWNPVGKAERDVQLIGANFSSWGESIDGNYLDSVCDVYWPAIMAMGL